MVAVLLPEAGHVLIDQREAPYPLRALPEIQVRHQQPGGPAVLGHEPLPVPLERDEVVRAIEIRQRQVGGEPLLGAYEAVVRVGFHPRAFQQELHRHALERIVEPAPARDAMDVTLHHLSG